MVLLILIGIVLAAAIFFTFFYAKKCPDSGCFDVALVKCSKASYINNNAEDAVWYYKITGKSEDSCEVYVKLLQLKKGTTEMEGLQGKSMKCNVPPNVLVSPQNNLGRCHGLLKEEMQTIIINRLHNYVITNLGKISEELTKPLQ